VRSPAHPRAWPRPGTPARGGGDARRGHDVARGTWIPLRALDGEDRSTGRLGADVRVFIEDGVGRSRHRRRSARADAVTVSTWRVTRTAGAIGRSSSPKTEKVLGSFELRTQSGREDSNLRPLDPQSSALTRLRYAPGHHSRPLRSPFGEADHSPLLATHKGVLTDSSRKTTERAQHVPPRSRPAQWLVSASSLRREREEAGEGLRFGHQRGELDLLVFRVEADSARAQAVDRRDPHRRRGARIGPAADERRFCEA
jgi:hypothetical protein